MNASQKPWLSIIALAIGAFYSGLTKTSTSLPRLSSKRTIL
ncbi:hypothetical protein [Neisseria meningitidis]|nr:hypothetical protein [Neisseria meningitidis]